MIETGRESGGDRERERGMREIRSRESGGETERMSDEEKKHFSKTVWVLLLSGRKGVAYLLEWRACD